MTRKSQALSVLVCLVVAAPAAIADSADTSGTCESHFTAEGGFLAGKKFSTWADIPGVSKNEAYARIYAALGKDGWNITSGDKESGVISANASVSFGKGSTAPLTIVVESAGSGSKATATFHIGGGQTTKQDGVKTNMCKYIAAASA